MTKREKLLRLAARTTFGPEAETARRLAERLAKEEPVIARPLFDFARGFMLDGELVQGIPPFERDGLRFVAEDQAFFTVHGRSIEAFARERREELARVSTPWATHVVPAHGRHVFPGEGFDLPGRPRGDFFVRFLRP